MNDRKNLDAVLSMEACQESDHRPFLFALPIVCSNERDFLFSRSLFADSREQNDRACLREARVLPRTDLYSRQTRPTSPQEVRLLSLVCRLLLSMRSRTQFNSKNLKECSRREYSDLMLFVLHLSLFFLALSHIIILYNWSQIIWLERACINLRKA